jgi:hypothetical protein
VTLGRLQFILARCGAAALVAVLAACGGGGGGGGPTSAAVTTTTNGNPPATLSTPSAPAANVATVVVDQGTDGTAINSPFVSVTLCVPGSSTCQTIDHILLDTGSYGLRLAASALGPSMALPSVAAPDGAPLAECAGFVSGFAWGSVRRADVMVSGETALGVPVQVVGDSSAAFAAVPTACSNTGPAMGVGSGSKGILGVGFLREDCGSACATSVAPAVYFSCPATGCVSTIAPLASQVTNPVALFATDNNGVVIRLPAVAAGGVPRATGELLFGVGTAPNNQLGTAQVFTADAAGNFTTTYKGRALNGFLDSGSNGIFLPDTTIPSCGGGFYCPASTLTLTATVAGANGASRDVSFTVESVRTLSAGTAAANIAGDLGLSRSFDWGLPFFFGRTVFVAIQGASTPFGAGPYWGF